MHSRAQSTIEYLVILAVVIVIGLAIVALSADIMAVNSAKIGPSEGKLSNKIGVGGISITESVADAQGEGIISLANNSGGNFTLTKITPLDSKGNEGTANKFNKQILQGNVKTFSLSDLTANCPCNPGDTTKACTFKLTINTDTELEKTLITTVTTECMPSITMTDLNRTNQPIECFLGENSCLGTNYLTCGSNNTWVNHGDTNGKCGYVLRAPTIYSISWTTPNYPSDYTDNLNVWSDVYSCPEGEIVLGLDYNICVEQNYDYLYVWDGARTSELFTDNNTYCGSQKSSTGRLDTSSISFNFTSDGSVTYSGVGDITMSCGTLGGIGESCTSNQICTSNKCNTHDNICSNGISGVDACLNNSDCVSGICGSNNLCVNPLLGYCVNGTYCQSTYCASNGINLCTNKTIYSPCGSNGDCTINICGSNNLCGRENGGACTSSSQCQSNDCNANVCANGVPPNGLVGYWQFNGNALDSSGNSNNGSWSGAETYSTGLRGKQAASFTDGTSYVSVANRSPFNFGSGDFTISGWFNFKISDVAYQFLMDGGSETFGTGWMFYIESNNYFSFITSQGGWWDNLVLFSGGESTFVPSENDWINVIIMRSGNTFTMYKNGAVVKSGEYSGPIQTISTPLTIGKGHSTDFHYNKPFYGKAQDVAIWNRALSTDEIAYLYSLNKCNTQERVCSNGVSGVDTCLSNIECTSNKCNTHDNICSNGVAGVDTCLNNSECVSDICGSNNLCVNPLLGYCVNGTYCQSTFCASSGVNLCTDKEIGSPCSSNGDCTINICGTNNLCGRDLGGACTSASQCKSNNCVGNVCASPSISLSGLIGYWPLDGSAIDYSGNGINGTISGITYLSGKVGQDANFSGNSAYIDLGGNSLLNPKTQVSVAVWVKTTSTLSSPLVDKGSTYNGSNQAYGLGLSGGKAAWGIDGRNNGGNEDWGFIGNKIINDGAWHLVVGTWNRNGGANNGKIYIDGILDAAGTSDAVDMQTTNSNVWLGNTFEQWYGSPPYFAGQLDEVSIWSRELSEADVKAMYNGKDGTILVAH